MRCRIEVCARVGSDECESEHRDEKCVSARASVPGVEKGKLNGTGADVG